MRVEIAQTAARQAVEGSHTARSWLTNFLKGRLDVAAAAEMIGLPQEVELFELARTRFPRWVELKLAQREARREREAEEAEADETYDVVPAEPAPIEPASNDQPTSARPHATPASERVVGFRVTKGPQVRENGRNRPNTGKTQPAETAAPRVSVPAGVPSSAAHA